MTTPTFTETLQVEVATLQTQHPILAGALDKAFALVVAGGVFPLDDGRTAHVQSQSDPTVSHLVNGTCDCKATQYHAAPCAHRLAFRVYQRPVERLTIDPEERWEPVAPPTPAPAGPGARPEAPASCNVSLAISGHTVQVTLRDHDEQRMLARLQHLLAQYPAPEAALASPQGQGKDWCPVHQVTMRWNEGKDGRKGWYSHKTDDGWCKGRP